MKQQTIKICLAVVRVFLDCVTKGNDTTLHVDAINNGVCRQLRLNKNKEKKNTRGTVIQVIKVLKENRVLCASPLGPEHDLLKRVQPVDNRTVYNISREAYRFVTSHNLLPEYASTSDATLRAMLHKFGVIPADEARVNVMKTPTWVEPPIAVETAPLVTTPPEPEEKETPVMAETKPTTTNGHDADYFEKQVITTIVSALNRLVWSNQHTPRALLGALRAANAVSADTGASGRSIKWEAHLLSAAAQVLVKYKLLAWRNVTPVVWTHKKPAIKHSGAYLTELGKMVADAGNYVDDRDAHYHAPHVAKKKEGNMLKNEKKTTTPVGEQDDTKAIMVPTPDGGYVRCFDPNVAVALLAAFNNRTAGTTVVPAVAEAAVAVVEAQEEETAPEKIVLSDYATIATIVGPTTKTLFTQIQSLLTSATDLGQVEAINQEGLYFAISELQEIIGGLKWELSRCFAEEQEFNVPRAMDYAAQVELEMEQLANNPEQFGNGVNPPLSLLRDQRSASFPKKRRMPDATRLNRVVWEG